MDELSQLKSAPNNVAVESTNGSAVEAVGAAAAKAAREASLKLSNEGNSKPEPKSKADAATSSNTMQNFFNDNSVNTKDKQITADDVKKLERELQSDVPAKTAPDDVLKAIKGEKERIIKASVKSAGDAATSAVKHLPDLQIQ